MKSRPLSIMLYVAAGIASTSPAHGAVQPLLGSKIQVKRTFLFDRRHVTIAAKDVGGATVVGDPVANGARVGVSADGDILPSRQTFSLPSGTSPVTGRTFWTGGPGNYRYRDPFGENGAVRTALIKAKSGVCVLKLVLDNKVQPLDVVPPIPGTAACAWLGVEGGDEYTVLFADGDFTNHDNELFQVVRPTSKGICCAHDRCTIGPALEAPCDPCVSDVCARDPVCCTGGWDALCVSEVRTVCGIDECAECGDGVREGAEVCDGSDGCAPGDTCSACSACVAVCGDGLRGTGEACDVGVGCGTNETCNETCTGCTACPAATVIPPGGGTVAGSTAGGTTMLASCGDSAAAPEKTFIWMPAKSGLAVFSTCGSTLDTVLYVRQDSCGGTELACNDDACGVASRITQSVTAGRTYVVVVDGFGAGPGGAFTLTVTPPP